MANTILQFAFSADATGDGGDHTLRFGAGDVQFLTSDNLAAMQAKLDAVLGSGNSTVTAITSTTPWVAGYRVEMKGVFANGNIPLIAWSSTLGICTVTLTRDDAAKYYHSIAFESIPSVDGGTYDIGGQTLNWDANPDSLSDGAGGTWGNNGHPPDGHIYLSIINGIADSDVDADFSNLTSGGDPIDTSGITHTPNHTAVKAAVLTMINAASGVAGILGESGDGATIGPSPSLDDIVAAFSSTATPTQLPIGNDASGVVQTLAASNRKQWKVYYDPSDLNTNYLTDDILKVIAVIQSTLTGGSGVTVTASVSQAGSGGGGGDNGLAVEQSAAVVMGGAAGVRDYWGSGRTS